MREAGRVSGWMKLSLGLTMFVLFAPLVVIIALSFNESEFGTLPFVFTLKWYALLFQRVPAAEPDRALGPDVARRGGDRVVIGTLAAIWLTRRAGRSDRPCSTA